MLKVRTTKELQTRLHTTDEYLIEFKYRYDRVEDGIRVIVDAYDVEIDENEVEILTLIPEAGSRRNLSNEEITTLLAQVKPMTPTNDDPLLYLDALIASGIKLIIVAESLWKGQLALTDFE